MMALTHCAIAAAGTSFILGTTDPLVMGLAIVGSQLPDLDTSTSLIGQVCFPVSSWIEDRYPHRSITHCFLASAVLLAASLGVCHFLLGDLDLRIAIALPLGHLLSVFSDTFTKQGVQLFFPNPVWCVCGSNPRRRLTTGSVAEYWVLAGAIALLMLNINLVSKGGIVQTASQNLGLKDGIVRVYNENASTNKVYARITGVLASDRSRIDGEYWVLGTAGSEFIVMNDEGIYKTGEQIVTEKINTSVGEAASTQVVTLVFDDEDVIPKLQRLVEVNPGAEIFLLGEVGVDFPEDIPLELQPEQLQVLSVSGSKVKLEYCPIARAITSLTDQYGVGAIQAKIVSPAPEGI